MSDEQVEYTGIVLYVGDGAKDLWYHTPGWYWGDPTSWMQGPYDTINSAYDAFKQHAMELIEADNGREG